MADQSSVPAPTLTGTPSAAVVHVEENPFGDFTDEQLAGEPGAPDRFFLKGYSDKRHARELDIKAGRKPDTLEHRFQYVSVESDSGIKTKNKLVEWQARGYRVVKFAELASLGIDAKESTVEEGAEGNARVGSQILMVTDAATAARHYKKQREDTARQFDLHVKSKLDSAVDRYNAKHGRTEATGSKSLHEEKNFEQ